MKKILLLLVLGLLFANPMVQAMDSIRVGNVMRSMIVYAPKDLPKNRPLIISMHGMNQDAPYQQSKALWESVSDTAKFVVVYPNGIAKRWDISGNADLDFIQAIIDQMALKFGIDRKRVYLSGFSMGGMMTYYAASKMADKIAAFAPVSGFMMRGNTSVNSTRPVPIIHTHGDADDVVRYPGLPAYLDLWVKFNQCNPSPVVTKPYPSTKTNSIAEKTLWSAGVGKVEVMLLKLAGKGHWYSTDEANGVHTSSEIWNFCKKYSL